ncbi:MAG: hypothetical protein J6Y86_07445 [Pseudobutyrivibrio sp.]|nr:hypothetical protein [Pseudobutyrivibrio sp.]
MAKYLVFKNGQTEEFTDESTITNLVTVLTSYAQIDAMLANFYTENFVGATFDGEPIENIIPVTVHAENAFGQEHSIVVTFTNRYKTDIELLQDQVVELQEAVAEIAGA